jgi:hypothetical protein
VSWAAGTSYDKLLDKLTSSQAGRALRGFTEPVISAKLWAAKPQARWDVLLDTIEPKLTARSDHELFEQYAPSLARPTSWQATARSPDSRRLPEPGELQGARRRTERGGPDSARRAHICPGAVFLISGWWAGLG